MSDLNEKVETVIRKTWDRSNKIRIDNEYKAVPNISYEIQTIKTDDDVLVGTTPKGLLQVTFDPNEVYPLIDPRDDSVIDPTGGNHFMIQVHLYSLFHFKTRSME